MAKKNAKVWEPEFKHQSVTGQFVDYAGNTRDFTMVAVSVPVDMLLVDGTLAYRNCEKVLTIGVAVRSAQDKDNGMGVRIAYGKALKKADHILAVTHEGMINTTMVDALLQQEAAYFAKNPGMYLAGYNDDKERYEKTGRVANAETAVITQVSNKSINQPTRVKVVENTNKKRPMLPRAVEDYCDNEL